MMTRARSPFSTLEGRLLVEYEGRGGREGGKEGGREGGREGGQIDGDESN